MKCTVCQYPFLYKGGENKEDFGCSNTNCRSREIQYYPHLSIKKDWYFAAAYHLPFEYVDTQGKRKDYNFNWYSLIGPKNGKTILQGLKLTYVEVYSTWVECRQKDLYSIPYVALPVNDDFSGSFDSLKHYMMNQWLNQGPKEDYRSVYEDFWAGMYDLTSFPFNSTGGISIDDKTKKLIELATNNSNFNEASNAAIKACQRIKKLLK